MKIPVHPVCFRAVQTIRLERRYQVHGDPDAATIGEMATASDSRCEKGGPTGTDGRPSFPSPLADRFGWPWTHDRDGVPLAPPPKDESAPRITVVTPSFNQGPFLEEAIRSVLLQDHPNVEYLIIDGGSSDQSVEIIRRYAPWIADWVSEPDDGQADAINKGFDRASGEYLCWLNSDDVLYQGFLSRRVAEFEALPKTDLIYGDIDVGWEDDERRPLLGEASSFLDMLRTLRVNVPQQGAAWRRSAVRRFGGLDPRWRVVLDREFFLRLIHRGSGEYIPGRCGFFRQHPTAKSIVEATVWATELPQMYEELFADPSLETSARELERETMATVHLLCFDILRAAGDWRESLVHLRTAMRWHPRRAMARLLAARVEGLRRRLAGGSDSRTPRRSTK